MDSPNKADHLEPLLISILL